MIHPSKIPLHSTLVFLPSKFLILFNKTQVHRGKDQARFLLVLDEEISEINKLTSKTVSSQNITRATKPWMAAWAEWCNARKIINLLKTDSEKR